MHWAHAVLVAGGFLAFQGAVYAQQSVFGSPCTLSDDDQPVGPEITIVEVTYSGSLQLPSADQHQIAGIVQQKTSGTSFEGVVNEGLERVRAGWQDRGYFKVEVTGEGKPLTSNSVAQRIALNVHVDEGPQYRLGKISFKNNKAISDVVLLRALFPINDGDIFSREKIATGLENLSKAYGEIGYINFTSIPETKFHDENKQISLEVDFDEGKQFHVGNISVLGLEEPRAEALLKELSIKAGEIYSSKSWEDTLLKYGNMFPDCGCQEYYQPLRRDEESSTVEITLDFRQCSAY